jgi:hypothetical protein
MERMMRAFSHQEHVTFALTRQEALVLSEALQRLIDDGERTLLGLLHSSAEFAVLCRLNNHLQSCLPETLSESYEDALRTARRAIIKQAGHYEGIEEREPA